MTIIKQKKELRKIFKAKRLSLSTKEVTELSHQISHNFIANLFPKICPNGCNKLFSLYFAANNEVETHEIAQFFYNNQIDFSYPKIVEIGRHLDFARAHPNQELIPNKFYPSILEPKSEEIIFPDVIILPLVAFDTNLSRLGMGGGFFDRTIEFLKTQNSKLITIGLGYDIQRLDEIIPSENSDQRLDFIVTEKSLIASKADLR